MQTQPGVGSLSGMSTEERKHVEEVRQEVKMWEPSSKETQRGREMETVREITAKGIKRKQAYLKTKMGWWPTKGDLGF